MSAEFVTKIRLYGSAETLLFASSCYVQAHDTIQVGGVCYTVIAVDGHGCTVRKWPWWRYLTTPVRQFLVRAHCQVIGKYHLR